MNSTADIGDFSLLVKPVSSDCNLQCDYCFYSSKSEIFGHHPHRMDNAVLKNMVRDFLSYPIETHVFCWQGGEPLLAGLDFYQSAVEMMNEFGGTGVNVGNAIQTNGTLIDASWAMFFRNYNFIVGISLDGPEDIHDMHRRGPSGGSYANALRGIRCLQAHQVPFNTLTVVNRDSAEHPLEIYRHLRDVVGSTYHQYIEDSTSPLAVSSLQWGAFLCAIFDEWLEHDVGHVSIRLFDSILAILQGQPPSCCSMRRECNCYLVVEHDGSVYPCDFHVLPEWRLGAIGHSSLQSMHSCDKARRFARLKLTDKQCRGCRYAPFCAGDCPRNRRNNFSILCDGYKSFLEHALPKLKQFLKKG